MTQAEVGWYPSILPARLEAEGVLAVHRADRVPVEADMAGDGVDVAPGALDRVAEMEAVRRRSRR